MIQAIAFSFPWSWYIRVMGLPEAWEPGVLRTTGKDGGAELGSLVSVQHGLGLDCLVLVKCAVGPLELVQNRL